MIRSTCSLSAVLLLLSTVVSAGAAQGIVDLRTGDRVRLALSYDSEGATHAVGTVMTISDNAITLQGDGVTPRRVLIEDIAGVERSVGLRRSWRPGATYGAVSGFFGGSLFGLFVLQRPRECVTIPADFSAGILRSEVCESAISGSLGALRGGGVGIVAGAIVGLVVGSLVSTDDWQVLGSSVQMSYDRGNGRFLMMIRKSW